MAQYGFGVAVRLKDGPGMADAVSAAMKQRATGWFLAPRDTLNEVDLSTLSRVVEAERQAVLISAWIAVVASVVFTGLTLARQLRRELADWPSLVALGLTRRGLVVGAVVRALVIGAIASLLAIATVITLSPLGPLGIARHLEYSHPIRFDWVVLGCVVIAVPALIGGIAALAAWVAVRAKRRRADSERSTSRLPLGAATRAALNFVHDGSPRLAVAVGAVAVAGAVAAGALVASFDGVASRPVKYGAWWDVAVGQYSDADAEQAGVATITSNPMVSDAAGVLEDVNTALVDGVPVPFISLVPYIGTADAVMTEGRSPHSAGEAAVGAATARRLHKRIGDTVTITVSTIANVNETVTITGIAVLNNPVTVASNAGDGIVLHPDLAMRLDVGSQVPQSIVVRFSPTADRAAALQWIFAEFPGTARLASPQADVINLQRLRFVPWLIAALIGVLALASLVHALVTLLQRHAREIAVLGALGMTRRQRRRIGLDSSLLIVGGCIAVGAPVGLVLGRWIWRVVARRISIPSSAVMAWGPTVVAPVAALAIALTVAAAAGRWVTRRTPAAQLHAE
jgi:predicted lysophospholipase L1 biosynthesis ABC-type transport system permease subunit